MLIDSQNTFSYEQVITSGATASTNTIKFGKGDVSYLPLVIQVVDDFSKAVTLNVKIQTSSTSDFTNNTVLAEATLALTDLTKGTVFPITSMPQGNLGYVRLVYTPTGDDAETTGKISAFITAGIDIGFES